MSAISGIGGVGATQIQGMDLETAMLAVQGERSRLLEGQLKSQIDTVQGKNDRIAGMNGDINAKQAAITKMDAAIPVNDAKIAELTAMRDQLTQVKNRDPNGWTGMSWGWAG